MKLTLKEVLSEIENTQLNFLHPNTEIQLLDKSSSAPPNSWLDSKIRRRIDYKDQKGKTVVGYEVSAPWTYAGTTDIDVVDYGKTWRSKQ